MPADAAIYNYMLLGLYASEGLALYLSLSSEERPP